MINTSFEETIEKTLCKELKAQHALENGILGGPHNCTFEFDNFSVTINQAGTRTISIVSPNQKTVKSFIDVYHKTEKILMLFDGRFIPLRKFELIGEDELSSQYVESRLYYYNSADYSQSFIGKLIDYDIVINTDTFMKWSELLNEADIMHQFFLYAMAQRSFTNDAKLAFLIETAEPMVELIKEHTFYFTTLEPGERGTSLKTCIDNLIVTYGQDIFSKELQNNYQTFLQKSVNTRVRIMHIKKNYNRPFFNETENILYLVKYSLLYRRIMLELLGISYNKYSDKIIIAVKKWEEWFDKLNKT